MNKFWALVLLVPAFFLTLSCGSSSNRHLQSITIDDNLEGDQVSFVATGTYSAPPTTVTPLPVSWSYAPPPGNYTLTTQPYTPLCPSPSSIVASAPMDPNAPISGSASNEIMITQSTAAPCLN